MGESGVEEDNDGEGVAEEDREEEGGDGGRGDERGGASTLTNSWLVSTEIKGAEADDKDDEEDDELESEAESSIAGDNGDERGAAASPSGEGPAVDDDVDEEDVEVASWMMRELSLSELMTLTAEKRDTGACIEDSC